MNNEREQVPGICREVGLSCKRCTEDSAASLAAVCKGLRGKAVTQLFHQMYPEPACASMSSHFAKSYRAASQQTAEFVESDLAVSTVELAESMDWREVEALPVRKEVTRIHLRTIAAVA